jgi:hypothetical protein
MKSGRSPDTVEAIFEYYLQWRRSDPDLVEPSEIIDECYQVFIELLRAIRDDGGKINRWDLDMEHWSQAIGFVLGFQHYYREIPGNEETAEGSEVSQLCLTMLQQRYEMLDALQHIRLLLPGSIEPSSAELLEPLARLAYSQQRFPARILNECESILENSSPSQPTFIEVIKQVLPACLGLIENYCQLAGYQKDIADFKIQISQIIEHLADFPVSVTILHIEETSQRGELGELCLSLRKRSDPAGQGLRIVPGFTIRAEESFSLDVDIRKTIEQAFADVNTLCGQTQQAAHYDAYLFFGNPQASYRGSSLCFAIYAATVTALLRRDPVSSDCCFSGTNNRTNEFAVGGVTAKLMAALQHNQRHILLPQGNQPEIEAAIDQGVFDDCGWDRSEVRQRLIFIRELPEILYFLLDFWELGRYFEMLRRRDDPGWNSLKSQQFEDLISNLQPGRYQFEPDQAPPEKLLGARLAEKSGFPNQWQTLRLPLLFHTQNYEQHQKHKNNLLAVLGKSIYANYPTAAETLLRRRFEDDKTTLQLLLFDDGFKKIEQKQSFERDFEELWQYQTCQHSKHRFIFFQRRASLVRKKVHGWKGWLLTAIISGCLVLSFILLWFYPRPKILVWEPPRSNKAVSIVLQPRYGQQAFMDTLYKRLTLPQSRLNDRIYHHFQSFKIPEKSRRSGGNTQIQQQPKLLISIEDYPSSSQITINIKIVYHHLFERERFPYENFVELAHLFYNDPITKFDKISHDIEIFSNYVIGLWYLEHQRYDEAKGILTDVVKAFGALGGEKEQAEVKRIFQLSTLRLLFRAYIGLSQELNQQVRICKQGSSDNICEEGSSDDWDARIPAVLESWRTILDEAEKVLNSLDTLCECNFRNLYALKNNEGLLDFARLPYYRLQNSKDMSQRTIERMRMKWQGLANEIRTNDCITQEKQEGVKTVAQYNLTQEEQEGVETVAQYNLGLLARQYHQYIPMIEPIVCFKNADHSAKKGAIAPIIQAKYRYALIRALHEHCDTRLPVVNRQKKYCDEAHQLYEQAQKDGIFEGQNFSDLAASLAEMFGNPGRAEELSRQAATYYSDIDELHARWSYNAAILRLKQQREDENSLILIENLINDGQYLNCDQIGNDNEIEQLRGLFELQAICEQKRATYCNQWDLGSLN